MNTDKPKRTVCSNADAEFTALVTFSPSAMSDMNPNIYGKWDCMFGEIDLEFLPSVNDIIDLCEFFDEKDLLEVKADFGTTMFRVDYRIWEPVATGMLIELSVAPIFADDDTKEKARQKRAEKESQAILDEQTRETINEMYDDVGFTGEYP